MLQRIRIAMMHKDWDYKFSNIVETDKAFLVRPLVAVNAVGALVKLKLS